MIVLIPLGETREVTVAALQWPLARLFRQRITVADKIALPEDTWNKNRQQYFAPSLLALIYPPSPADRSLAVADVDVYAPGLNFVFGQADTGKKRALISLRRMRQEFYGLPPDERLLRERMLKEAIHELGHTYGLRHCPSGACVMRFSSHLDHTDAKVPEFCPTCHRELVRRMSIDDTASPKTGK